MKIKSKDVKAYLLECDNIDTIGIKLNEFLGLSFHHTINGIYNAIYKMLKRYDDNKYMIDAVLDFLSSNIDNFSELELKTFISLTNEFNNNLYRNIKKKEKIAISDVSFKINQMFNYANNRLKRYRDVVNDKRDFCLEYMIFEDKNLPNIKKYLDSNIDVLRNVDAMGEDVFYKVIKKYCSLDVSDRHDLEYYKNVIMLFICGKLRGDICRGKAKYLSVLNKSRDKFFVNDIIKKINNSGYSSLEELNSDYNISTEFSDDVFEDIFNFRFDYGDRCDFTYQDVVTIDKGATMCYDDALFMEKTDDDSYNLYIHVTDIPSFVPYDSITNREAYKREESLYFKDGFIPMYPQYISENVCSLWEDNIRNTITLVLKVDKDFKVFENNFKIVKGRIKVKKNLSFDEADDIIVNGDDKFSNMLRFLFKTAYGRRMNDKSKEVYRKYENIFSSNDHHESLEVDSCLSANIVQEMMVLYNYIISKYFRDHNYPYIYRDVVFTDDDKVKSQLQSLWSVDINNFSNDDVNKFRENLIKSRYVNLPNFHKGLNLSSYSHSGSPARRYADSFCQYLIYAFVFNDNIDDDLIKLWNNRVRDAVEYLNSRKVENEMYLGVYGSVSRLRKARKK